MTRAVAASSLKDPFGGGESDDTVLSTGVCDDRARRNQTLRSIKLHFLILKERLRLCMATIETGEIPFVAMVDNQHAIFVGVSHLCLQLNCSKSDCE